MRRVQVLLLLAGVLLLSACKATPPARVETAVMTRAKKLLVGNRSQKNPFPATADNIATGRESFSHYCAACHGLDGQNTGVPFAERMSPPVPKLNSHPVQAYSDGQLKWIIDNGMFPSGMPASRGILNDDEIWSIVVYIRHLPSAGSLGEPCMYSGENCPADHTSSGN